MAVSPEVCEVDAENVITVTPSLNMAKQRSPVPVEDGITRMIRSSCFYWVTVADDVDRRSQ